MDVVTSSRWPREADGTLSMISAPLDLNALLQQ